MATADTVPREVAAAYRRELLRAAPIAIALPILAAIVLTLVDFRWELLGVIVGAVGWNLALLLRGPVAWFLKRRGDEQLASPWFVAASGPTEELVRLGAILLLGRDLETAVSIGFGWAAIEVGYSVVQGLALATLMERDDPEAERIRALIPAPAATLITPEAPWLGIVERVWASALHLGFTVILAAQPLLVLLTIPAHSATNLVLLRATERLGLRRLQLLGMAWATLVVLAAVVVWTASAGSG
jgi:hypothetical protein